MFEQLSNASTWEEFLSYKIDKNHLLKREEADLRSFIENREYLPVIERILAGTFSFVPEKKLIQKIQASKKRTVYIFPRELNYVLKLLTYLLIRKYDSIFANNLYSFRVHFGVNKAISNILSLPNLKQIYSYKVDISNYFNTIPVDAILEQLDSLLCNDSETLMLFKSMLNEPYIMDCGKIHEEIKGAMAGTPTAVFLANLYLKDLDDEFFKLSIPYARYSDDIIFFADSEEDLQIGISIIKNTLSNKGLIINPSKEITTRPGESFSFLGICYKDEKIDVAPISVQKIKDKIRRKARAIKRWQIKKGATNLQAVRAFIRSMNHKFFDAKSEHDMTWTRWYFPLITTDESLHEIDLYMQYWIRFLYTGKHNQKNYNLRYETLKENGYINLVHEYYKYTKKESYINLF